MLPVYLAAIYIEGSLYLTIIIIIRRRRSEYNLSNNPQDEVKGIIQQYSLSLRRIIVFISIIAQVIIRETVFSFILLVSSLKTSINCVAAILKISASVL